MYSLLIVFLLAVFLIAILVYIDKRAAYRSRAFADRHGLRSLRGEIDRTTALGGTIGKRTLQIESIRRALPRGGNIVRVAFMVSASKTPIAFLRRYRGRYVERTQGAIPSGMERKELPAHLASEYELWMPAGGRGSLPRTLEDADIQGLLSGFWALHEIQWLGEQIVFTVEGDTSYTNRVERAWRLIEKMVA